VSQYELELTPETIVSSGVVSAQRLVFDHRLQFWTARRSRGLVDLEIRRTLQGVARFPRRDVALTV
jgi:hypothetical protein